MTKLPKPLRIFISSPVDVAPERRRAALVIEKLAKDYARFLKIEPYLWESEPMLATGHFQAAILSPGEADILVLILWARLGTPLPEQDYRGIDGRAPVTGTEWEFEIALAAHRRSGLPDVLAYKKNSAPKGEYKTAADAEELGRQLRMLDAFWSRYFVDRGEFRAAFSEFNDLDNFEAKLESDLQRLIVRRIAALQSHLESVAAPTWAKGSPFRGLETYRFEHGPIFFGRGDVTKTAVEQLVRNADEGRPFLLVLGASGSGKSSLAQAGIVPALGVRGVVAGVCAWRRAIVRPGSHPEGPFMALATAIAEEDALPEILKGQDVAALARHLQVAAADPSYPILSALAAREQAARQRGELMSFEQLRIVLVLDQLEELFTHAQVTPEQRTAFILCLKGLMGRVRVYVIATMRSDYWHRAIETPLLVELAEGYGRLDLLPPTQAELTEMIRRSAEVSGLFFEIDPRTEIRLDAALADEASREPGVLPLLSFLLDALYAKDISEDHGSTLRYDSMRQLGGLKGAIVTRAEAAFAALPADVQGTLSKVLRALVSVSGLGAVPSARSVPTASFTDEGAERHLVDAFLDPHVRLLVADGDGDSARIRLAHEALITHWERARTIVVESADFYRIRSDLEEARRKWDLGKRRRELLLARGLPLAEAESVVGKYGQELSSDIVAYVRSSRIRANRAQMMGWSVAVAIAVMALGAGIAAKIAVDQQSIAAAATVKAKTATADLQWAMRDPDRANAMRKDFAAKFVDAGKYAADKHEFGDAVSDFRQAILFDPTNPEAYEGRGAVLIERGSLDDAIDDFDHAIQYDSNNPINYISRGFAYREKGDFDKAIADFSRTIQLEPRYFTADIYRGDVYRSKGDLDDAVAAYNQAVLIAPDILTNIDAYVGRALAFREKDNRIRADADFERAIAISSEAIEVDQKNSTKHPYAYLLRGKAYRETGDLDRAISDFDQAINQEPIDGPLVRSDEYRWRGDAYLAKGDFDQAIANFNKSLDIRPNPVALDSRGFANLHLGRIDEASADFDASLGINPKFASALYGRGMVKLKKGDQAGADSDVAAAKAIKLDVAEELRREGFY